MYQAAVLFFDLFRCVFPPKPTEIVFAKPGSVAFSSVLPVSGRAVRVGDTVAFSAKAAEGVSFTWKLSDGTEKTGDSFTKTFATAGTVAYSVTASKTGLLPASAEGKVEIIDTGVALAPVDGRPVVGQAAAFTAVARGPVTGYEWIVDGLTVAGNAKLSWTFERSGEHTVQVRALYKNVLPVLSEVMPVKIAPAPFVAIRQPEAGAAFDAEEEIVLQADVEGDFAKIIWKMDGADSQSLESPVVKNTSSAKLRLAKGGVYKVVAVAEGEAGTKAGEPVPITVRSHEYKIIVSEPPENETIENGKQRRYTANVKGRHIEKVKWLARDVGTGARLEMGTSFVGDGKSSLAYAFPLETGDTRFEVSAEAVFAAGSATDGLDVVSAPLTINTFTTGDLTIVREESVNGKEIPFGEQVPLKAVASGAVRDVRWFVDLGNGAEETGKGESSQSPKVGALGRERVLADFWAEGRMPDGSVKKTGAMRVVYFCPFLNPRIKLPEADGVTRAEFGLTERIPVEVIIDGQAARVEWAFGDGTVLTNTGRSAAHAYTNYNTFTIVAHVQCEQCGRVEKAHTDLSVVKAVPVARFKIIPDKERFSIGSVITAEDCSEGDVAGRIWMTNGVEIAAARDQKRIEITAPSRVCAITISLVTTSADAEHGQPFERTVRIRYGWWAAVLASLAGMVLWIVILMHFTGNGMRFCIASGRTGPRWNNDADEKTEAREVPVELKYFWRRGPKFARVPVNHFVTQDPSDIWQTAIERAGGVDKTVLIIAESPIFRKDYVIVAPDFLEREDTGTPSRFRFKHRHADVDSLDECLHIRVERDVPTGFLDEMIYCLDEMICCLSFVVIAAGVAWLCYAFAL